MKITMTGSGYVGLVTGACLAEVGNDVLCLDTDASKIRMLNEGGVPIYEPGLEALIVKNVAVRFPSTEARHPSSVVCSMGPGTEKLPPALATRRSTGP